MKTLTQIELDKIKEILDNFKSPWLSRKIFWLWFNIVKFLIIPMFIIIFILMMIYNQMGDWNPNLIYIWWSVKGLALFWIGWGLFMTIAHVVERGKMRIEANKIGLSIKEWDYYINYFNIQRKW